MLCVKVVVPKERSLWVLVSNALSAREKATTKLVKMKMSKFRIAVLDEGESYE